ncbi:MAG: hypothetical protein EXQ69_04480 [Acidimicrobiia bacterium]|nr:hypothetical protein [Acidimicrobiia bacterium]
MPCGCIAAALAVISPRLALFAVWLFTDRLAIAFDSLWVGLIGFLLLPWTTLGWAVVYQPNSGVSGFGWLVVIFAFMVDISTFIGSSQARRTRPVA